jgi:ribosomal protein S18 acetylase RimI-like enzyme
MKKQGFIIRELRRSDAAHFLRYETEIYKERVGNADFGQVSEEKPPRTGDLRKWFSSLYKSVSDGDAIAYVAESNGRIAGLCTVMRQGKWRETSHIGVLGIDVLSNYRSVGLGSALINKAIERSRRRFEIIECSAFSTNKGAIRLYQSFGFRKCGVLPRHIKRGNRYINNVLMFLRLC